MTAMTKETDITGQPAYDVETIRTDFPILFREVYGKPLVYLDNGASAQKPRSVLDAIDYAYKMEYANVHRGLHFLSNAATARYENARETVRRFLNAPASRRSMLDDALQHVERTGERWFAAEFIQAERPTAPTTRGIPTTPRNYIAKP